MYNVLLITISDYEQTLGLLKAAVLLLGIEHCTFLIFINCSVTLCAVTSC